MRPRPRHVEACTEARKRCVDGFAEENQASAMLISPYEKRRLIAREPFYVARARRFIAR